MMDPRDIDTSVPVVVLKMHHGSLGIARSLGRLGIAVHGLTGALDQPSALSRYWNGRHAFDVDQATSPQTLDCLCELSDKLGRRALLIAVSDATSLFVAENAMHLRERFMFPEISPELVRRLISKKEMCGLVGELDIATAETRFPQCRADVLAFLDDAVFPVMVKGIHGVRLYARAKSMMAIARNAAELLDIYDRWEDPASPNLMLQEYIPGGDDTVWMFNGYFNAQSECVVGWTGRKLRQTPVAMGSTSLGLCTHNEEVSSITRRFMQRIGYRGILDIGYRYDARDGQYKVLDVNPRIGSTFRLFVDANGLDVVRTLYLDMTGQPVPGQVSAEGRKWVVEDGDIETFYKTWRKGELGILAWLLSFRGVREAAYFARDDMQPFHAVSQIFLQTLWRRILRQMRLALPTSLRGAPRVRP